MTILALIIAMMSANASDVTLVVKQIDNSGLVQATPIACTQR